MSNDNDNNGTRDLVAEDQMLDEIDEEHRATRGTSTWTRIMSSDISWEHEIKMDEVEEVLRRVPDGTRAHRYGELWYGRGFPWHLHEDRAALAWTSLEAQGKRLGQLRWDGLQQHTHAHAHALAHAFRKLLDLWINQLRDHPQVFRRVVDTRAGWLRAAWQPVFNVLVANAEVNETDEGDTEFTWNHAFTKREKQSMLAAVWEPFAEEWERFSRHDWNAEYRSLWDMCYQIEVNRRAMAAKHGALPAGNGGDQ